jgi:hypothetical protein
MQIVGAASERCWRKKGESDIFVLLGVQRVVGAAVNDPIFPQNFHDLKIY